MKMSVQLLCFILLFVCFACKDNQVDKKQDHTYIISKCDSILNVRWKKKDIPPPPTLFYGDYNFIFNSDSKEIYLHRKSHRLWFCGTGIDWTKPDFINLYPTDFVLISPHDLDRFLADTAIMANKDQSIVISSFQDTIRVEPVKPLINYLTTGGKIKHWNIRIITEEEKIVLEFKKKNSVYSADSIKWSANFSNTFEVPKSNNSH